MNLNDRLEFDRAAIDGEIISRGVDAPAIATWLFATWLLSNLKLVLSVDPVPLPLPSSTTAPPVIFQPDSDRIDGVVSKSSVKVDWAHTDTADNSISDVSIEKKKL